MALHRYCLLLHSFMVLTGFNIVEKIAADSENNPAHNNTEEVKFVSSDLPDASPVETLQKRRRIPRCSNWFS